MKETCASRAASARQLRKDPALLITIRQMVDATPFWKCGARSPTRPPPGRAG